jgi:AcrR family transcriptional regulator
MRGQRMNGRPRSLDVDEAVLQATVDLLATTSFAQLSIEQIAKKAGVGKPAVYRRWPSKAAVVADALGRFAPVPYFDPKRDPADSLRRGLIDFAIAMIDSGTAHWLYSLLGEARTDPELAEGVRARYLATREPVIERAIRRCADAGAIRRDVNPGTVLSLLMGPPMHGWILTGITPDKKQMTELVNTAWAALEPATDQRRKHPKEEDL